MLAATTAAAANDRHWHAVTATTTHSPSDLFTMSTLSLPDRKSTAWTARLAATQPSCDSHGSAASKDLPRLRKPMLRSGAMVPHPAGMHRVPATADSQNTEAGGRSSHGAHAHAAILRPTMYGPASARLRSGPSPTAAGSPPSGVPSASVIGQVTCDGFSAT